MDWTCYRKARRPVVEPRSPPHGRIRLPTLAHIHRCAVPRAGGRGPRTPVGRSATRREENDLSPWPSRARTVAAITPQPPPHACRPHGAWAAEEAAKRARGGRLAGIGSLPSRARPLPVARCSLLFSSSGPPPVLPHRAAAVCSPVPSRPIPIPIRACLCASLGLAKEPSYRRLARPCRSLARAPMPMP